MEKATKWWVNLLFILGLWIIGAVFFAPIFSGKELMQSDTEQWKCMAKEIMDFRKAGHGEALWTGNMFSGMPAFMISVKYPMNLLQYLATPFQMMPAGFMQLAILLLCSYIMFAVFGVNPWLSSLGAIAFAFSTYNPLLMAGGHNTKLMAMAYGCLLVAGVWMTFNGRKWLGWGLTGLGMGLELMANHLQITYYFGMVLLLLGAWQLYEAVKQKQLKDYTIKVAGLVLVVVLALGANIAQIWSAYDYSKFTMRGGSELVEAGKKATTGLDKDYAMEWSYGVSETFTVLVPNAYGGGSAQTPGLNSNLYKECLAKGVDQMQASQIAQSISTYWGDMPSTGGPFYYGVIVIFLYIFSLIVWKSPLRWWSLVSLLLMMALSWGKHFENFSDLFFNYIPGYNKFRAVSTTLVMGQLIIPFTIVMALSDWLKGKTDWETNKKPFFITTGILGGLLLIFAVVPGVFMSFEGQNDQYYVKQGFPDWAISALVLDREEMCKSDAMRALLFMALGAATLWLFLKDKIKVAVLIPVLALLTLVDLWSIDKRYLGKDSFVSKSQSGNSYQLSEMEMNVILRDSDPNFRVYNMAVGSPFMDARPAQYYKIIGGYNAAKLRRYQDVIERHIAKGNVQVLNMLNAKYFVFNDQQQQGGGGERLVQQNPDACGNAWFVNQVKTVKDANEAIEQLKFVKPKQEAIVESKFAGLTKPSYATDSTASIKLTSYKPNELQYESNSNADGLVVFSEIYYPSGWEATIDGKVVEHIQADYILRAMPVPAGQHKIVFKFRPKSYETGGTISLACSLLLLCGVGFAAFKDFKRKED